MTKELEKDIEIMKKHFVNTKLISAVLFEGKYLFSVDITGPGSGGVVLYKAEGEDAISIDMGYIFDHVEEYAEAVKNTEIKLDV